MINIKGRITLFRRPERSGESPTFIEFFTRRILQGCIILNKKLIK